MSLFNRPAWAKQQLSDDDNDNDKSHTNIFSHSHAYNDIVADRERRKREQAERKKVKAERRNSKKKEVKEEPNRDREHTPKRRRITTEDGDKLLKSIGLSAKPTQTHRDAEDIKYDEPEPEHSPGRKSPRKPRDRDSAGPRPTTETIEIGDSSDEDEVQVTQAGAADVGARSSKAPAQPDPAQDDSDDEFAELARKARQQREQQKSRTPATISPSPGVGPSNAIQDKPPPPPDPTVELLVTSPLPGTNPLIVHRKLSQRIQEIRLAWCQKQGFPKEYSDSVFFIHRMRRVYDVTTCRSLGLEADQWGNIYMLGAEGKEGVEKVHLEAVTQEVFQEMKEAKAKESKVRSGELEPEKEEVTPAPEPVREGSHIRITMKAKGRPDFRLKVKPVRTALKVDVLVASVADSSCRQRPSPKWPQHTVPTSSKTTRRTYASNSTAMSWSPTTKCRIPS